ncbi:TPA: hypothetical protein U8251_003957 [Pseudomonas putida]|nr:hypothetical protein [Pseudomonas putida]
MWLYSRIWGYTMLTRQALAAVLRSIRGHQQLSREAVQHVETRTLRNLENAKTGVTLETLSKVGAGLAVHPLVLQILATCVDEGVSPSELMAKIAAELEHLESAGVTALIPQEIVDGGLATRRAGKRHSSQTIEAVRTLKSAGKSQKEIYEALGLSRSTVGRIWKSL